MFKWVVLQSLLFLHSSYAGRPQVVIGLWEHKTHSRANQSTRKCLNRHSRKVLWFCIHVNAGKPQSSFSCFGSAFMCYGGKPQKVDYLALVRHACYVSRPRCRFSCSDSLGMLCRQSVPGAGFSLWLGHNRAVGWVAKKIDKYDHACVRGVLRVFSSWHLFATCLLLLLLLP